MALAWTSRHPRHPMEYQFLRCMTPVLSTCHWQSRRPWSGHIWASFRISGPTPFFIRSRYQLILNIRRRPRGRSSIALRINIKHKQRAWTNGLSFDHSYLSYSVSGNVSLWITALMQNNYNKFNKFSSNTVRHWWIGNDDETVCDSRENYKLYRDFSILLIAITRLIE